MYRIINRNDLHSCLQPPILASIVCWRCFSFWCAFWFSLLKKLVVYRYVVFCLRLHFYYIDQHVFFMPIHWYFCYYSSLIQLQIRDGDTSSNSFTVQSCFICLGVFLCFHVKFEIVSEFFEELLLQILWKFYWLCRLVLVVSGEAARLFPTA